MKLNHFFCFSCRNAALSFGNYDALDCFKQKVSQFRKIPCLMAQLKP
jgi:hypothetical protein